MLPLQDRLDGLWRDERSGRSSDLITHEVEPGYPRARDVGIFNGEQKFQIPPDLVVKSQPADIIDIIL